MWCGPGRGTLPAAARTIGKRGRPGMIEVQADAARGSIAILADINIGGSRIRHILVIRTLAVKHENAVGVLFDRTGIA